LKPGLESINWVPLDTMKKKKGGGEKGGPLRMETLKVEKNHLFDQETA